MVDFPAPDNPVSQSTGEAYPRLFRWFNFTCKEGIVS
jgi:hypothetical protein